MNSIKELLTISNATEIISMEAFVLSILSAMLLGVIFSLAMQYKNPMSKSFSISLAILPPVVCVVIIMVNGSIGAGIAVAGTFSLVRFRSIPGSAKEIAAVFTAMAIGLSCSMGNLLFALLFTVIIIAGFLLLHLSRFGETKADSKSKVLRITIPDELDYGRVFSDLLESYTSKYRLTMVKTINLGIMYKLIYEMEMKDPEQEKELIDKLRTRNGNLEISCSLQSTVNSEL